MRKASSSLLFTVSFASLVTSQTFQRLGTCPTLGCILPPDQSEFLAGQLFDVRLEVHAPVNGSEASNGGVPDEKFTFCVQKQKGGDCVDAANFFGVAEPKLENWTFSYYHDLSARDAEKPTVVNVASKIYRAVKLSKPGTYTAKLSYNSGSKTLAKWTVPQPNTVRKAKNVLFFIGDGMTQSMITAARLLGHKSINGKYQSLMQMDEMDNLGHQMTHSIDSFITDSANSATALYSGKKSTVNCLNVWADSSKSSFDDPKMETIAELFRRRIGGALGIVSTAYIADATPAALCAHTRDRGQYPPIVVEYLHSAEFVNSTYKWPTGCKQPDVIFGGGAEQFIAGKGSPNGTDYYKAFADEGYKVVHNKTDLLAAGNHDRTLGIFSISNLAKWVDRNVLKNNLKGQKNSPTGDGTDATDQPGLKEMTLKGIDILQARSKGQGWFMMSEAANIDKMMHVLDYGRALGELLELDDTIRASIKHLKEIGEYHNTLIVVTSDHGHGFDVFGSADTEYIAAQTTDRKKRGGVGVYYNSGQVEHQVEEGSWPTNQTIVIGPQGPGFPVQWNPRFAIAAGMAANPDHRESYSLNMDGPRVPATEGSDGHVVNPKDHINGFMVSGTLPIEEAQGVHSLTDVSVFANGPGAEAFRGLYNNVDIFFKIADALGLGCTDD